MNTIKKTVYITSYILHGDNEIINSEIRFNKDKNILEVFGALGFWIDLIFHHGEEGDGWHRNHKKAIKRAKEIRDQQLKHHKYFVEVFEKMKFY